MSITVELDKDIDHAEGIREYTMCGCRTDPEWGRVPSGPECIYERNEDV